METIAFSRTSRAVYMSRGPRTIEHGRLFSNTRKILKF